MNVVLTQIKYVVAQVSGCTTVFAAFVLSLYLLLR